MQHISRAHLLMLGTVFFPPHCLLKWTSQSPAQRKRESVIAPFQASSRFHLNTLNLHMTHLDSTHLVPSQTVPLVSVEGVFEISSIPNHFMRSVYCSSTPDLDLADFPPPVCVCFLFFVFFYCLNLCHCYFSWMLPSWWPRVCLCTHWIWIVCWSHSSSTMRNSSIIWPSPDVHGALRWRQWQNTL